MDELYDDMSELVKVLTGNEEIQDMDYETFPELVSRIPTTFGRDFADQLTTRKKLIQKLAYDISLKLDMQVKYLKRLKT